MSRSYAFSHPPADLSRSLLGQVQAEAAELVTDPHAVLPPGQAPVNGAAVARALRRRRWPGHRISSFLAQARGRAWSEVNHRAAGLRRTQTRAARHRDKQELQKHFFEELD